MRLSWVSGVLYFSLVTATEHVWRWECVNNSCVKRRVDQSSTVPVTSLGICQLLCCEYAALWPKPTGTVSISDNLAVIYPTRILINKVHSAIMVKGLIQRGFQNFLDPLLLQAHARSINEEGNTILIGLNIQRPEITQLGLHLDESYELKIFENKYGQIEANITADNYFGFRHGLETLAQLIVYDEIFNNFKIPIEAFITDKPAYTYRGLMLDTSRNFFTKDSIKRTIDGMSASKLNTFHWHITDSHSFPYAIPSQPELAKIGAYSSRQIYNTTDVQEIVEYALERGVRVLPEMDAPAHVGEGWQDTGYLVCFNKEPWQDYCFQPPCGMFDPTKDGLYDILENIYGDMIKQFNPDIFHMGGDEVALPCWNSSVEITNWMRKKGWGTEERDFVKLWSIFQDLALERLDKQLDKKLPIILWSSTLTKRDYIEKYLAKDRYIIQTWAKADDQELKDLLELGYDVLLSNYDALYLDCGVSSWVTAGPNWCAPYKGWHEIYDNSPAKIGGVYKDQFIGAEALLWTEQVDDASIDIRMWPRAAAMAERLWSEPDTTWGEAEQRILIHRQRLVDLGISADALEPQWCMQNQQSCPLEKIHK